MSVDERILRELEADVGPVTPDEIDIALTSVVTRGRRRRFTRRATVAVGVAAAVLLVVAIGPTVLRSSGPDRAPAEAPTPVISSRLPSDLLEVLAPAFGRYRADPGRPAGDSRGAWHLYVSPEGRSRVAGTLDGSPFDVFFRVRIDPSSDPASPLLLIDLMDPRACPGVPAGVYSFAAAERHLIVDPIHEPCRERRLALTAVGHAWVRA